MSIDPRLLDMKLRDILKLVDIDNLPAKKVIEPRAEVQEFWAYYLEVLGMHFKREPKLIDKRRTIINARLRKFSLEELKRVVDYTASSPFHLGKNDVNKKYVDIDHIMGNDLKVERKLEGFIEKSQQIDESEKWKLQLVALGDKIAAGQSSLFEQDKFGKLNSSLFKAVGQVYQWDKKVFATITI